MGLEILQKIQERGLLPMLMQHLAGAGKPPGQGGPPTGATPGWNPTASMPLPTGPPGVGAGSQDPASTPPPQGAAPPTPQASAREPQEGGPQVKYDPSSGGGSLPPPIAQPYEAVQSVHQLLTGWTERKHKKEEAEAANIAQNLMQALKNKDTATVHDILNDQHSKKILDKVYKGWLTKMQEQQKPGKEPDPTVSGFEAGLSTFTQKENQASQPASQPPGSMAGVRLPQASPQDQLGSIKASTELQAAKGDPARTLSSRLTSGEMRETELGAGPEKVQAEKARAEGVIKKAASDVQRAVYDMQRAEAELKIKQQQDATSKEVGKVRTDIEHNRYLKSLVDLDIARAKLKHAIIAPKVKQLPINDRIKIESLDKAINIVESVQKENRGFAISDVTALSNELKAAGASELVKRLPSEYTTWLHGKGTVSDFADALKHYKEGLKKAFDDGFPGWEGTAPPKAKADAVDETNDDGEGVDADIVINPEDMAEKPPQ